jgi:hypothetical protein
VTGGGSSVVSDEGAVDVLAGFPGGAGGALVSDVVFADFAAAGDE